MSKNIRLITVAIPTLNRPRLLRQTLESVLAQTWSQIEIIVSDNASAPETAQVISSFDDSRIRAYRQSTQLEMVPHWNFCLSKAEGEWFILLSDDDLLLRTALEELIQPLMNGGASLSYSPFITINGEGAEGLHSRPGPRLSSGVAFIHGNLASRLVVPPSGVLGRTEHLRALGGFPNIGTTSDLGLRLLMAVEGPVACLPKPLLHYRVHGGNLSGQSTMVVESHLAFERWAHGRAELAPYHHAISAFAWRVITGYGLRSALAGDPAGAQAAMDAIGATGVSKWRKWIALVAIRSGELRPIRTLMVVRDKCMRFLSARA